MADFLRYEQQGHIVTLTMNEPERRNPLTGNSAVDDFLAAIARIRDDRSVRAVVLTGAGAAFSTGGNIRDMERRASGAVSGPRSAGTTATASSACRWPCSTRRCR